MDSGEENVIIIGAFGIAAENLMSDVCGFTFILSWKYYKFRLSY